MLELKTKLDALMAAATVTIASTTNSDTNKLTIALNDMYDLIHKKDIFEIKGECPECGIELFYGLDDATIKAIKESSLFKKE